MRHVEGVQLTICIVMFLAVSGVGFYASRWRRGAGAGGGLDHLDEWGLGGRSFGGWVTWFLLGGDLYTAYTFVAVPALVFASGGIGFFAVPYTIIVYPMVMIVLARLWSVSHVHGLVTPADFVRARSGSSTLALLVALTGIVATMPYIALQLVGIEAVLKTMGVSGQLPLVLAFVVLAAYTYSSGLRAPALIAFAKDALVYLVVLVAVIVIPVQLHGFGHIFSAASAKFDATPNPTDGILLAGPAQLQYATLALGSALALFLYPHSMTGVFAARSRATVKRNMAALPAYSFLLGLLSLLGYMAIAAKVKPLVGSNGKADGNTVIPLLFDHQFPSWFAGICFAAIAIGALVPAAIMSIAAANLWTRNIYKEYLRRDATPAQEARMSKLASLVVKVGALLAILVLDPQFSIDLQLIGGVIMLQTLPAVGIALYTRWLHRWALVAGWVAGMATAIWTLYQIPAKTYGANGVVTITKAHFGGSAFPLSKLGLDTKDQMYAGAVALLVNLVVVLVLTPVLRALKAPDGVDVTRPQDYTAERGDPRVSEVPEPVGAT